MYECMDIYIYIYIYIYILLCDFHNIINSSQCGFRKGLNTLHAIENLQKTIIDSLISNKYFVGLFIDLKKAFDNNNNNSKIIK